MLVGAQGARSGGGTRITHFPYELFQPLTKLAPALPGAYIPWKCSAQPTELPVLLKTAPGEEPKPLEQGATKGWDEQKSKTPTRIHSQISYNLNILC